MPSVAPSKNAVRVALLVLLVGGLSCARAHNTQQGNAAKQGDSPAASEAPAATTSASASAAPNASIDAPKAQDVDVPEGSFHGANAFEAPPSAKAPPIVPPPARPAGTDPPADDRARALKSCAQWKSCGSCNNAGFCGYCGATQQCVPRDKYGPYPGTCPGDYSQKECSRAIYLREDEATVRERLADLMEDLKPDGMPMDRPAKDAALWRIPVRRGVCYGAVFRDSYDRDGSIDVQAAVEAPFIGYGGTWRYAWQDIGGISPFCPQEDGRITIEVKPKETTKGTLRVQLFSKPIPETALREQLERYETGKRIQAVRYYCGFCARVFLGCFLSGEPRCDQKYVVCLSEVSLTAEDCARGDIPKPAPPRPLPEANAAGLDEEERMCLSE